MAMEEILYLSETAVKEYLRMIPNWLILGYEEGEVEFWGLQCFGAPAGVAALRDKEQEKNLLYLYIDQDYRRAGRGARLLQELIYGAYQNGYKYFSTQYMQGQYPVYEKLLCAYPFQSAVDYVSGFRVTLQVLEQTPQLQGAYKNIRALSACSQESLTSLYQELTQSGKDLVSVPLNKTEYIEDCCAVAWEKDKPAGFLLVKEENPQTIRITYMVNLSGNILAPIEMMRFALQMAGKKYPPETVCVFDVINESLFQLLKKIGLEADTRRVRKTLELSYFNSYVTKADVKVLEVLLEGDNHDNNPGNE